MFITLDGIDGTGKSTQIDRLTQWFRDSGKTVTNVRDPGSTPAGEAIRGLLLDSNLDMHRRCEALLYMAARTQMVHETITPALDRGEVIISDRFLLANAVYQSVADRPDVETVQAREIWQLADWALPSVRPDLTILLDMPAIDAANRRSSQSNDRMEARGIEYLEKVRQAFLKQIKQCGGRHVIVNANQSPQSVFEEIVSTVEE
ncbi:MAG: dTMP kinase [Planctomycetota bacterium]